MVPAIHDRHAHRGAARSRLAAYSPANPPPRMSTWGSFVVSRAPVTSGPRASGSSSRVPSSPAATGRSASRRPRAAPRPRRRRRCTSATGGRSRSGSGRNGGRRPPAPAAEGPGGLQQVEGQARIDEPAQEQGGRERQPGPGGRHARIIDGLRRPTSPRRSSPHPLVSLPASRASILSTMATAAPAPPRDYRAEFPIFRRSIYLNSCSLGALSLRSRARVNEFLDLWETRGASAWYDDLVGGAGRAAVALRTADRGAGGDRSRCIPTFPSASPPSRSRSTTAGGPRSWSRASTSRRSPTSGWRKRGEGSKWWWWRAPTGSGCRSR